MEVPLELAIRHVNIRNREQVEEWIEEKIADLERACDHIISCRIVIEAPHHHHQTGNPMEMRVIVRIPPGHEIVVREQTAEGAHDNVRALIQHTFGVIKRRIREVNDRQHDHVKIHPEQVMGAVVARVNKEDGHGFLRTIDDREIYFHRNSVLHNDFDRLEEGTGVRYVTQENEEGLSASTVQIVDKHPSL